MRKKYLSALLFGALLVTSAGTFTSCKDYDDDINNLQEQITANADAIKKLQEMIGDGKFVTNIVAENNGLKITWNDDSSTVIENVINGEAQQGDVVSIDPETGEIKINNEGTGFFASKGEDEEEVKLPYVNDEGVLVLVDAEGKEVVTGIRVAPVTAVVNEDGSAVLTIIAADGTKQTVNIPSAASMISSIELAKIGMTNPTTEIEIFDATFNFDANGTGIKASEWKGTKTLPNDNDHIIGTQWKQMVKINPASVDVSDVDFKLTNTKNQTLPITLKADAESNSKPFGETVTTRANNGNGLWNLSMDNMTVKSGDYAAVAQSLDDAENGSNAQNSAGFVYALNVANSCRSDYNLTIANLSTVPELSTFKLKQGNITSKTDIDGELNISIDGTDVVDYSKYNVGTAISVIPSIEKAMYDMYLEADKSDVEVYGLTFDQEKHTFTIGKNPDVSSVAAKFKLIVWTVDIEGEVNKATVTVNISSMISSATKYELTEHGINKSASANYFGIDLSVMKEALGDKLNTWLQNVDLTPANITYSLYANENASGDPIADNGNIAFETAGKLFTPMVVEKLTATESTSERGKANYIKVKVDNTKASSTAGGMSLDKTYSLKITFKTNSTSATELNSIIVPVKFTAPSLTEIFKPEEALIDKETGAINAYFNMDSDASGHSDAYMLSKAFKPTAKDVVGYLAEFGVAYVDQIVGETEETTSSLAMIWNKDSNPTTAFKTDNMWLRLKDIYSLKANGVLPYELGYKQLLPMEITATKYDNWAYAAGSNDGKYTYDICLMSALYEGEVKPVDGTQITVSANAESKAIITSDMIKGYDYNKNEYDVVPNKYDDEDTTEPGMNWTRDGVKLVTVSVHPDYANLVRSVDINPATYDKETKTLTKGNIELQAATLTNDQEVIINVAVQDVWGYTKVSPVKVLIKVNK